MLSENMKSQREEIIKASRIARNKAYYEKLKHNKKTCEACCCEVIGSYWEKHLETGRHKKYAEIKAKLSEVEDELKTKLSSDYGPQMAKLKEKQNILGEYQELLGNREAALQALMKEMI